MVNHPWVLTGPWYRWDQPGVIASGRVGRPVFQKYETANFVAEFLKDPQHSLKFLDPDDFAQEARLRDPALPPKDGKQQSLSKNVYVSTGIRKLFLDAHKRFYLVVCELHCDAPGFPSVTNDQVCETGFVVRKRSADVPEKARSKASLILKDLSLAHAQLAQIDELPPGKKVGPLAVARASAAQKFNAATAELQLAAKEMEIRLTLLGWVKSAADRVGSWQEVEETPQTVVEDIFPMYPLIPDPRIKNHSGGGRTLFFGVIPTASADTDDRGNARFDDASLYEVRCFMRQHRFPCPKKRERNDCHGTLYWSQRSAVYRVASHFDLAGTSNRPVTIQLPDIPALEAQAATLKPGQGAPVRMVSPLGTPKFSIDTGSLKATLKGTGGQICSFSLPLITIVATFVFQLFLPVVTFVLGLFFLLKLKFCIPPSIDLSAGVTAALSIELGSNFGAFDSLYSPDVEADVAASIGTNFGAGGVALPDITAGLIWEDRHEVPA
jgi:hypothetical protein